MSSTLLRLGVWIIVAVVAAYVLHETYAEAPFGEYFSMPLLQKGLLVGGLLLVAGVITRVFEKGSKAVSKNRCVICKTPIPTGAIYCRAHLRNVLAREDERTHLTRTRR